MLVQDLIKLVVSSELKSLAVADVGNWSNPNEEYQDTNIQNIISYINAGLIEIHKDFDLKIANTTIVHTVSGSSYPLPSDFLKKCSSS